MLVHPVIVKLTHVVSCLPSAAGDAQIRYTYADYACVYILMHIERQRQRERERERQRKTKRGSLSLARHK